MGEYGNALGSCVGDVVKSPSRGRSGVAEASFGACCGVLGLSFGVSSGVVEMTMSMMSVCSSICSTSSACSTLEPCLRARSDVVKPSFRGRCDVAESSIGACCGVLGASFGVSSGVVEMSMSIRPVCSSVCSSAGCGWVSIMGPGALGAPVIIGRGGCTMGSGGGMKGIRLKSVGSGGPNGAFTPRVIGAVDGDKSLTPLPTTLAGCPSGKIRNPGSSCRPVTLVRSGAAVEAAGINAG